MSQQKTDTTFAVNAQDLSQKNTSTKMDVAQEKTNVIDEQHNPNLDTKTNKVNAHYVNEQHNPVIFMYNNNCWDEPTFQMLGKEKDIIEFCKTHDVGYIYNVIEDVVKHYPEVEANPQNFLPFINIVGKTFAISFIRFKIRELKQ